MRSTRRQNALGQRRNRALVVVMATVALLASGARAQSSLDETCTVSVLNRNALVNHDGSYILPNVPANFGQVRARATCERNGVTVSGQSDFFIIPSNGSVDVPPIFVGVVDPIPTSLVLTATQLTLGAVGATSQLTVTAHFADGSTRDVTLAGTGTNYTISNPAIATVSGNGLITAAGSGAVVVSASNDGALGMLRVQVILGGDSDGDGLPDDLEVDNGLDPSNPVDAEQDLDGDGLSNKQELLDFGTDIRDADSDDDGLNDGEEVFPGTDGFVTSPVLVDTDGDGVRDGLEVQSGSDPTNPASINLAQTLQSIRVQPDIFVLTVNTIVGEASRQLSVTGQLRDGTTIDLTSTVRGTNYDSSDVNVCNFGSPDGRVFAGNNGLCAITVTNNGFSTVANGGVQTFAPVARGAVSIPGYANNVDVSGDYAFVAAGSAGLQVVDVSNPSAPQVVASEDTPGNANDVRIVGTLAFVADGSAGLQILDVTDPLNPDIVGSADTPGEAQDVVVQGMHAFVADGSTGLQVVDVQTPSMAHVVGSVDTAGTARGVGVSGTHVGIIDDSPSNAVRIIDVGNPQLPSIVGSVAIPGSGKDLVMQGSLAYVAAYTGGLQVVDFSDAANPAIVGSLPTSFVPRDVEIFGPFALFAEQLFPNAVPIVEISLPNAPSFRATLDFSPLGDYAGTGIALTAQYVYMTGEFFIVGPENGTSGNTRLFIGQYLSLDDTAGIPPTVEITAPADGSSVPEGSMVAVTVDASDDIAVSAVGFFVNGVLVGSDTGAPYQFNIDVPIGATSITIGASAVDTGGNIGTATDITLTVTPDPAPSVSITAPEADAVLIEGEQIELAADATDNVHVDAVDFVANGVDVDTAFSEPFSVPFTVPTGITSLTVEAIATDNLGRSSTAMRTVTVIPDPLTTVTGVVEDANGDPVAGATITCFGLSTTSLADGSFMLSGVSTVEGDVRCVVRFTTQGGQVLSAIAILAPVRGGTTNLGAITLSEGLTFSVEVGSVGVSGSGIEQAALTDEVATSIYRASGTGSNQLVLNGVDLGINPIGRFGNPSNIDALDVLNDGSFIFSVDFSTQGVPGSAVEAASGSGRRPGNVYRSTGNGSNELYLGANAIGIEDFSDTNLDALALLPDGSVLFSIEEGGQGVDGSALAAADEASASRNVYRSFGNGTNELFRSAAQLGISTGDLLNLVWNADGSLLYTVTGADAGPPDGEPAGAAAGEAPPTPTPVPGESVIYRSTGDGTRTVFFTGNELGIASGEVDALLLAPAPTDDAGGNGPTVVVESPAVGQDVIEDDTVVVRVTLSDDVAVASLRVTVVGSVTTINFPGPSAELTVRVPLGVGAQNIEVVATDLGNNSTTVNVPIDVVPDPGTTVIGVVVDTLAVPVADATVTVDATHTATTAADGSFSIANVATIRGPIVVRAAKIVGSEELKGKSTPAAPVAGGTTNVGTFVIAPGAVVGYYDLNSDSGNPDQINGITVAGFTPVDIDGLTNADLSEIDILLVQNPDNGGYFGTLLSNTQKIADFVQAGGVLVFHDRHVTTASSVLPGEPGDIFRDFVDDANIDIIDSTTAITDGPGGMLTNASLDGGNSSSHGYAIDTANSELHGILSRANPAELVTYWYRFGNGKVIYSTIPLDYYLDGNFPETFGTIYAPNVIAFANDLRLLP